MTEVITRPHQKKITIQNTEQPSMWSRMVDKVKSAISSNQTARTSKTIKKVALAIDSNELDHAAKKAVDAAEHNKEVTKSQARSAYYQQMT